MARGIYKRIKKVVSLEEVIKDFQEFAEKTSPDFRCCDAAKALIWNAHTSRKLGLTFNGVKRLAGLPVRLERDGDGITTIGPERQYRYKSVKPPKRLRGELTKPCLGILPNESYCGKKVPKGQYFCETCRDRKNSM